jgi:abhydrolase domain-containing protein 4
MRWNKHSKDLLNQSEATMLSGELHDFSAESCHLIMIHRFLVVKVPFDVNFVSIGDCVGTDEKIWTLSANVESKNPPIVLIHGFAAALGFWLQNIDFLAQDNPVYAIDLLGFGKSSRPNFAEDADEIELQYCESIERWRKAMNIPEMILLGHSFGGFLSTSYAMRYEQHILHLILADPWGFTHKPDLSDRPYWQRSLVKMFGKMAPLSLMRAAGPWGEWLIQKARRDIMQKYEGVVEDPRVIATYIHQCNTDHPSGELAFKRLLFGGPWAKNPMGERMKDNFPCNIPVTFLYGAKSWMDNKYGEIIKESRPSCYTHIEHVSEAGHHVYADNADDFNQFTLKACKILKSNHT